jgi:hypothetical protein
MDMEANYTSSKEISLKSNFIVQYDDHLLFVLMDVSYTS